MTEDLEEFNKRYNETMSRFKKRLETDSKFRDFVDKQICRAYRCWLCGIKAQTHGTSLDGEENFFCYDCLDLLQNNRKALAFKLWNQKRESYIIYTPDRGTLLETKRVKGEETDEQSLERRNVWKTILGVVIDGTE